MNIILKTMERFFRNEGIHPMETTEFPDGTVWVKVPPWEVTKAKTLVPELQQFYVVPVFVFPMTNPKRGDNVLLDNNR